MKAKATMAVMRATLVVLDLATIRRAAESLVGKNDWPAEPKLTYGLLWTRPFCPGSSARRE